MLSLCKDAKQQISQMENSSSYVNWEEKTRGRVKTALLSLGHMVDMVNLVPGLLIFLAAVQAQKHDGKWI